MFTQAQCGEGMAVRGEGGPLHACVKVQLVYNNLHTIHTGVFSFTMFTASTVFYNCSLNNYAGILKIHQGNIREFCFLETLSIFCPFLLRSCSSFHCYQSCLCL